MERFGIRYDLLPRESEILHLHFWQKAFEEMKRRGVIKFETEGKSADRRGRDLRPFLRASGARQPRFFPGQLFLQSVQSICYLL
jgi:hypothetical protein